MGPVQQCNGQAIGQGLTNFSKSSAEPEKVFGAVDGVGSCGFRLCWCLPHCWM